MPNPSPKPTESAPAHDATAAAEATVSEIALTIPASDGFALAATCFCPPDPALRRARVIIGPATGVLRRYYAAFARALAARGFEVLTLDYRGIGDSAPPRLRGFEARMFDWGTLDLAGALRWALDRAPGLPTRCHIHPRDVGARAIGHFGCFRPAYRDTLWARAIEWLERHAGGPGAAAPRDASTEAPP